MSTIKAQLSTLIELAKIDGEFDGQEKLHILMLGRANGLSEVEIKEIVKNPVPMPNMSLLSSDDKFDYLFNIMSDAFSAIIIVGALVLPEVIFGIMDASTTLKFCKPCTESLSLTTASSSFPILQVPTG